VKWKNAHRREEPPKSALAGSLLVHGVVVVGAAILSLTAPDPVPFESYRIEIVSPPPAQAEVEQEAAPVEELEIETPDQTPPVEETPRPPEPEPAETPPPAPEPEPEVEETPPPPDSTEVEPAETTTTAEVEETAEETGEDIEVRMEGLRRDYPVYYENIVTQIRRCWRPPRNDGRRLSTTIYFVIKADGTVADTRFVERSGVASFDFPALAAIADCASGRFGALPEDLGYDRLPIQFEFRPAGGDAEGALTPTSDAA
jgi:outer membrane biosynthesis protein TonB